MGRNLIILIVVLPLLRKKCLQFPGSWDSRFEICSKFEKFPEILELLECLEILELDYTAIRELPLSIEHLTGLRHLSLRFCQNLECLPNTIHKLTSLKEIRLVHCRNLKSLPVLPLSLSILDAYRCTSLETVSSTLTTLLKQNWDDLYTNTSYKKERFSFIDCGKSDENACKILMDEAEFRIFRFATLYSKYGAELDDGELRDYDDLVLQVYIYVSFFLDIFIVLLYNNDSNPMMFHGTEWRF